MSSPAMPQTPNPSRTHAAFEVGDVCELLRDVTLKESITNRSFTRVTGEEVKIISRTALNTTGNTDPISSSNAGYRVGCKISVQKDEEDGGPIFSSKVKHAALSSTPRGKPLATFWKSDFLTIPRGSKVYISSEAVTNKGSKARNTAIAVYTVTKVKRVTVDIDIKSAAQALIEHKDLKRVL